MAQITLKGNPIHTNGELPAEGSTAPAFSLVGTDLAAASLDGYSGKKVLNVFPSLDTPICAMSIRRFAKDAVDRPGVSVLNISADLPFAHGRFCTAEGIEGVDNLSTLRSSFASDYGLEIVDGPLAGLCSPTSSPSGASTPNLSLGASRTRRRRRRARPPPRSGRRGRSRVGAGPPPGQAATSVQEDGRITTGSMSHLAQ